WRDVLPDCKGRFDLVLSDFTLGNLDYYSQSRFLQVVAQSLTTDGYFADRVLTYPRAGYDYDRLARLFSRMPANLQSLNAFNARWLFCGARVTEEEYVDSSETYDWSIELFADSPIGWFIRNCEKISPRGTRWYYGKPWSEVERWYRSAFQICSWAGEPIGSAFRGWAFLLVSKKSSTQRRFASQRVSS